MVNLNASATPNGHRVESNDDQESALSAADLGSILKWSKDISSDINLSSGKLGSISFLLKEADRSHSAAEID